MQSFKQLNKILSNELKLLSTFESEYNQLCSVQSDNCLLCVEIEIIAL